MIRPLLFASLLLAQSCCAQLTYQMVQVANDCRILDGQCTMDEELLKVTSSDHGRNGIYFCRSHRWIRLLAEADLPPTPPTSYRYTCSGSTDGCAPVQVTISALDVWGDVQLTAGNGQRTNLPTFDVAKAQCMCEDGNTACTATLLDATTLTVHGKDGDLVKFHCYQ